MWTVITCSALGLAALGLIAWAFRAVARLSRESEQGRAAKLDQAVLDHARAASAAADRDAGRAVDELRRWRTPSSDTGGDKPPV